MLTHLPISLRIHLTTLIAVVGLLALAGIEINARRDAAETARTAILRHLVEAASTITAHYQREEAAGRATRAEAQSRALEAIRAIRYRGEEYVWVNDMTPIMVMHPFRPDLEGKPLGDIKDPTGFRLFVGIVDAVRASGSGTVGYLWPRPGAQQPVEKLSYVQQFAPWDWVLGSGVYVDDLRQEQFIILRDGIGLALLAATLVGLLAWMVARGIVRPLAAATRATVALAGGDLTTPVPGTARRDELGVLAKALETFRAEGLEKQRMASEAIAVQQTQERRRSAMASHTQDFGASISGVMGMLGRAAEAMRQTAEEVASGAERTSEGTAATAAGAAASAQNLAAVASATEELTASVSEVARQVGHAATAMKDAVTQAEATDRTVRGLSEAAGQIGSVVRLIGQIAGQTNLLALNATIEAARAGEAGKGFAVVASEVKTLAGQTASATQEISRHIATIQAATGGAVEAVAEVGRAIARVDEVSTAIAAAVEQQAAATHEIAQQVQSVSRQTEAATESLALVAAAAEGAGSAGRSVRSAADEVAQVSHTLREEVDQFLTAMRREDESRRQYERIDCGDASARICLTGGQQEWPAKLRNISRGGAALVCSLQPPPAPGNDLRVTLPGAQQPILGRVARVLDDGIALVFRQDATTLAEVDAAIAMVEAAGLPKARTAA